MKYGGPAHGLAAGIDEDMETLKEEFRQMAIDCMECGSCSYVCPSSIPLVQYLRQGKADIQAAKR